MVDFNAIILQAAQAMEPENLPEQKADSYYALIFYIIGAFTAFYFYRKIKKKKEK